MATRTLNLMFIDEEQLYAEKIVGLLSHYYDDVNLGFWDEKSELTKALRNDWDVLVFNRAYDMSFTDVIGLLNEQGVSLPMIQLTQEDETETFNEAGLPEVIDEDMVKSLRVGQEFELVLAICLLANYSQCRRQIFDLKYILKEAEQRTNILIANSKSAVAYIDQGVHIFANDPYLEMFGYENMDEIIGVPVVDLISGGDNVKGFKQFLRRFDKGDRSQVEFDFESKKTDGSTFASKLQLASATFEGEPVVQVIIQNNETNTAELNKQLAAASRQDNLTGLGNRLALSEALTHAHQDAMSGVRVALLYISMDSIGKINSSAGLAGVDASIKYIANVLKEEFAEGFVSRFGDASFAVLIFDVDKEAALEHAEKLRARAESLLIEVGSRTVTSTLSVGVVMIDKTTPDGQTALERAVETVNEIASDSDNQGNQVKLFDISKHAADDENALGEYIQGALVQNQFVLKFQPAYDINTDTSDLFEVYVTLPTADGNALTYDKLVAAAKKHNLLDKIDRWVLINAAKALATTRKTQPKARLLIGLSSVSLASANLAKVVAQLTKAIGDNGSPALTLQFHEQDLVDYLAAAKRQFRALSELNCGVGVQNFGATAKSADIIEHLSPDIARLARTYTKDLDRPNNMQAVQALVAHANEQGVAVLMPYIEDASTMSLAWSIGARHLQGNYLQAPAETLVYATPEA